MNESAPKERCPECGLETSPETGCLGCSLRLALSPEAVTPLEAKRPLPTGLKSRFFGDYEILEEIARGGMGVVYRARQLSLNRLVALKMIQSHHLLSDEARLRFRVEIESVAQLHHPHIVSLYESGEHESAQYFTMSLVDGGDLAARFQQRHPIREQIQLLVKVCRAVHYAHQRGILHRDLKPSNILVDQQGEPHVADFGLAKSVDQDSGFTFTSSVLGSPNYMAPEQAAGKTRQLTTSVDVYGLGAILYHLLAGCPPFQAKTPIDTLRQVVDHDPAPPRSINPRVDSDLETIALKCLCKEPQDRYDTAEGLAQDLERWLAGDSIVARPLGAWAVARRWCRRKPGFALLAAALAASLVALVTGSTLAAWRIRSANQRTEALVTRMQIQKAEELFSDGETSKGLAMLAHVLRQEPAHAPATLRLLSGLQHRSYALPVYAPVLQRSPLMAVSVQSEARELLTLTQAGEARRWNLDSGEMLGTVFDLHRPIKIAAMTGDAQQVLIGFRDGAAQLRSGPSWDTVHEFPVLPDGVVAVAFSPSGRMAAAASVRLTPSFQAGVGVWDTITGRPVIPMRPHELLVTDLKFTRDERHVVTVCADSQIRFWPVSGTAESPSLVLKQKACLISCFDDSGRWMAVGEYEGGIKVWDMKDLSRSKWSFQHARRINDLRFNSDASLLLSASADDTAQVWNLRTGTPHTPAMRHGNIVNSVRFSPDERHVVTASNDNTARLWDTTTGLPLTEELPHETGLNLATFTHDSHHVLTTTYDGAFAIWELREPFIPTARINHSNAVSRVRFSRDGTRLVSGSSDGEIRITDAGSGEPLRRFHHDGPVNPVAFSPDGRLVAAGGAGRTVQLFDASSGNPVIPPLAHEFAIENLEFDPSGTRILVTAEVQAQVWDTVKGRPVGAPMRHRDYIESAHFSPDGQLVVTTSKDRTIQLWSAVSGEPVGPPIWDAGLANHAEFSPDGDRVLVTARSHEAFIVSTTTRRQWGPRMRHGGSVSHAAFSRDGTRIVTASEDQTAKVWAPDAPEPLIHTLTHRARVSSAEFSPDGRMILTLSSDGVVRLWDSSSGLLIADSIRRPGATFACFSPDNRRVAVSATDGTVLIRTVPEWPGTEVGWLITLAEQVARQRFLPPDRFDPMPPESQTLTSPAPPASLKATLRESMVQWLQGPARRRAPLSP